MDVSSLQALTPRRHFVIRLSEQNDTPESGSLVRRFLGRSYAWLDGCLIIADGITE